MSMTVTGSNCYESLDQMNRDLDCVLDGRTKAAVGMMMEANEREGKKEELPS